MQELDGWADDAGLEVMTGREDDAGVGTIVCTTVVVLGTTCVTVNIWDMKIVDTNVEAGIDVVITIGEPDIVNVVAEPGMVTVLRTRLVTVLAGDVDTIVLVTPG